MMFLFPRWDMLVPWRVPLQTGHEKSVNSRWKHLDIVTLSKLPKKLRSPNSELVSVYDVWECMLKKCLDAYVYIITNIPIPDTQCMVYLATFTIKIYQM